MAGLDSLVSGFVDGMNVANSWKDRRRAQQLEDEDRARAEEDRQRNIGWATEDRATAKGDHDRTVSWASEDRTRRMGRENLQWQDEDRQRAQEAAERELYKTAFATPPEAPTPPQEDPATRPATAFGGMGGEFSLGVPAPRPAAPVAPPQAGPAGAPGPNGPASYTPPPQKVYMPVPSMPDRPSSYVIPPPAREEGQPGMPAQAEWANMTTEQKLAAIANQPTFDSSQDPNAKAETVYRRASEAPPSSRKGQRDQQAAQRAYDQTVTGPGAAGGPMPPAAVDPRLPPINQPGERLRPIPLTQEVTGPVDMPRPERPKQRALPAALDPAKPQGGSFQINPAPRPLSVAPGRAPAPTSNPNGPHQRPEAAQRLTTPGSGSPPASRIGVQIPPNVNPATAPRSIATAANQSGQETPALQIALGNAPTGGRAQGRAALSFGEAAKEVTAKQRDAGARAFQSDYLQKGVPKVVEFYMQTGQFDKAEAFTKWAADSENQKLMGVWAKGVQSAAIGDFDGMLDHMSEYYTAINPNLEVVRDQSGMVKDEQGNITGANITYRDKKTGEYHTETYHGMEDMIRNGVNALSPESMFELLYQEDQANVAAALKSAYARPTAAEYALTPQGRIDKATEILMKNDLSFAQLPPEEQRRKAVQYLRNLDQGAQEYANPDPAEDVPLDLPPE